jgi:hypothetical protein
VEVFGVAGAGEVHVADDVGFGNITTGGSAQTFTVTRSVNGVVKTHSAGAEVRLWRPPVVGL